MRESTRAMFKKHGWRIDRFLHNYIYFAFYYPYVRTVHLFLQIVKRMSWFNPLAPIGQMAFDRYHAKVLSVGDTQKIFALSGFEPYFGGSFVREFPVKIPGAAQKMILKAMENGLLCGVNAGRWFKGMDDCLIVAVTEKRTAEDVDRLADTLKELAQSGILSGM